MCDHTKSEKKGILYHLIRGEILLKISIIEGSNDLIRKKGTGKITRNIDGSVNFNMKFDNNEMNIRGIIADKKFIGVNQNLRAEISDGSIKIHSLDGLNSWVATLSASANNFTISGNSYQTYNGIIINQ